MQKYKHHMLVLFCVFHIYSCDYHNWYRAFFRREIINVYVSNSSYKKYKKYLSMMGSFFISFSVICISYKFENKDVEILL